MAQTGYLALRVPQREPEIEYIGANIARLRERAGFTQATLAERAGLSSRAVSIVEGGLSDLSVTTLCRLAHALGVKPAALLREAKPRPRLGRGRPAAKK